MNLILANEGLPSIYTDELRNRGCNLQVMPVHRVRDRLRDEDIVADAIVCFAEPVVPGSDPHTRVMSLRGAMPLDFVIAIRDDIADAPSSLAMADGRKWKSIPFVVLVSEKLITRYADINPYQGKLGRYLEVRDVYRIIHTTVSDYRRKLLDELDNLGFLVSFSNGRYRLGPALKAQHGLESSLYYGPADKRRRSGNHFYTVDRDAYGIQYEIEIFEALINRPGVTEGDLQNFFEENPHFLVCARPAEPLPHVPLTSTDGKLLVPDFVLKPIVAVQRDSNWEVLDLKKPQVRLLAGKAQRVRLSHEVMQAIAQLRDYGDYFRNPNNSATVEMALGHRLRHPKLAVLIGRMPKREEIEALEFGPVKRTRRSHRDLRRNSCYPAATSRLTPTPNSKAPSCRKPATRMGQPVSRYSVLGTRYWVLATFPRSTPPDTLPAPASADRF